MLTKVKHEIVVSTGTRGKPVVTCSCQKRCRFVVRELLVRGRRICRGSRQTQGQMEGEFVTAYQTVADFTVVHVRQSGDFIGIGNAKYPAKIAHIHVFDEVKDAMKCFLSGELSGFSGNLLKIETFTGVVDLLKSLEMPPNHSPKVVWMDE